MSNTEIFNRPLVEWTIELHDDIKKFERPKRHELRNSPLKTITQIRGHLTADGLGLVIDPDQSLIEGYYIVLSDLYMDESVHDLNEEEFNNHLNSYAGLAALVYKKTIEDKPELVGVFDPEDDNSWKEVAVNDKKTPATFRLPQHILDEYRVVCSATDQSLTDVLVKEMWNTIRNYRAYEMDNGQKNILGNGEIWHPFDDRISFFTSPLVSKLSKVER